MNRIFSAALLWLAGVITLSCAEEKVPYQEESLIQKNITGASGQVIPIHPSLGELYTLLLTDYFSILDNPSATIAEIDAGITALMASHGLTQASCSGAPCDNLATQIAMDPIGAYNIFSPQAGLSPEALTGFSALLQSFSTANDTNLQQEALEHYSAQVQSSTTLTSYDKEVLRITCEIAIASLGFGNNRKDKDWETSVGNVVSAFRGAVNGPSQALRLSLVTGIATHYLRKS